MPTGPTFLLETERTFLRPWTENDFEDLRKLFSDPEELRYISNGVPFSEELTRSFLSFILDHYRRHGLGPWAVVNKTNGEIIGLNGLKFMVDLEFPDLGFNFKKNHWGQGFATEVCTAILDWGFQTLGLQAIGAHTSHLNLPSVRVLKSLGMQFEKKVRRRGMECDLYILRKRPRPRLSRLRSSQRVGDAEIKSLLNEFHNYRPGSTDQTLGLCRTEQGHSSYEILLQSVPDLEDKTILDVACGSGPLIRAESALGAKQITGVDSNAAELKMARATCPPSVRFLEESAEKLSIADHSIDAVFCHLAFMLMRPIEEVVSELHRVLKAGGVFAAVTSTSSTANPLFTSLVSKLLDVLYEELPTFRGVSLGDSRTKTREGISALFSPYSGKIEFTEFEVSLTAPREELVRALPKFFYYSDLISEAGLARLQEEWLQMLTESNVTLRISFEKIIWRKDA